MFVEFKDISLSELLLEFRLFNHRPHSPLRPLSNADASENFLDEFLIRTSIMFLLKGPFSSNCPYDCSLLFTYYINLVKIIHISM